MNYIKLVEVEDELFDRNLLEINSLDKAGNYVDQIYKAEMLESFDTLKYVEVVSGFAKKRFYHGLSHYNIYENWIAVLAGKVFWTHMSAIVNSDDILKYPYGLCSQQTIVFMELLKRKGIKTRSVGLGYIEGPGHFLSEVYYQGSWHLYDISVEPIWAKINNNRNSMDYYLKNRDSLYIAYESRMPKHLFDKITERVVYGEVNDFPAKNMLLFHKFTLILTYLMPFFCLIMFFYFYLKVKK